MTLALEAVIKMSLIVLTGLAATLLLARRSAALRHWLLAAALGCAAVSPALEAILPAWQVRLGTAPGVSPASAPASGAAHPNAAAGQLDLAGSAQAIPRARTIATASAATAALSPASWMVLVWIVGTIVCVAMLAVGIARLTWLASRAQPVGSGRWRDMCDEMARLQLRGRRVALLQSAHPTLLVTWGITRPKIIVPADAPRWTEDRIRIVLAHELAHIERGDWVVQLLGEFVRAAYWFNPLVWAACSRLRRESELACDDAVLSSGVAGSEYAAHLLDLARALRTQRHAWVPAAAIVGRSSFEGRIRAMLNRNVNRTPVSARRRLVVLAAMLATAVAIASAQTSFARMFGTVADQMGGSVPNTRIVLTHVASGTKHEVRSNGAGAYEFVGLIAGEYQLDVEAEGFSATRETLTLSPGEVLPRNPVLQLGLLHETITVVANAVAPPRRSAPKTIARPCEASNVSGRIRPPTKVGDVRPRYPRNQTGDGLVELEALIGTDGTIKDVQITTSPNIDMANAAVEAVRQWEYTPTLLNCAPVEVHMQVLVAFRQQ